MFPQGTHDDLFGHGAWEKTRSFVIRWGADKKRKDPTALERWSRLFRFFAKRGFGRGLSLTLIWTRSTRRLSSSMILRCGAGRCLSGLQVRAGLQLFLASQ